MPQYYIWTIGCQMNKAESERLGGYLEHLGYQAATDFAEADLIVLNSCVVRQSAENRIINKLHALKSLKQSNPQIKIALTGCLVDSDNTALKKKFTHLDYCFKPGEIPAWLGEMESIRSKPLSESSQTGTSVLPVKNVVSSSCSEVSSKPFSRFILPSHPSVCTYVPIMQGCNNFCSYCIVPYRRGRERSRLPDEVICEVKGLVQRGVKEVTLVGQNVDSYGHDLPDKTDLADLLHQLNSLEGLLRIRFLTNHPKDMSSKLIDAITSLDNVCEQINLPVQAGDDIVLKAMKRGYTSEQYRTLVKEIRLKVPEIAISSDVIVGFPGETEEQFQNTYNLLAEIKFDMVHVAAYSPRTGTMAAREMADNVPSEVKKDRLTRIEQLQEQLSGEINARLMDNMVEVLVEVKNKDKWQGRMRTDKLVFFNALGDYMGQLVKVKITHTSPWSLSGKI